MLLVAAALVGIGSSVFHPESSRVARMASGGRHGFAQSLFQVGGNVGSAIGPLLAAFIVLPHGQGSIAWFSVAGAAGHGHPVPGRHLVRARTGAAWPRDSAASRADAVPRCRATVVRRHRRAGDADLLQVLLHGEPWQLLHLLPHRPLRRLGAAIAALPVRVPRRGRGRHASSAGRSATASAANS